MSVEPIIYSQEPIMTPRERTIAAIKQIALRHQLRFEDIFSPSRTRKIVDARTEAIIFVWSTHHPKWSYPDIGNFFGKDHTTIMYAVGALKSRKPRHLRKGDLA